MSCIFGNIPAQVHYGIKGGLNISDVVMNDVIDAYAEDDFNLKAGFHGGVFAGMKLNETWGAWGEIQYSIKGVRAAGTNINLHYITVPLLFKYFITENFRAEAGPELGYMVTARSKYGNASGVWNNNLDIGLDAGIEYQATATISLGLRFNAGMLSVIDAQYRDSNGQPTDDKVKYQNRVLQLSLSFLLGEREL